MSAKIRGDIETERGAKGNLAKMLLSVLISAIVVGLRGIYGHPLGGKGFGSDGGFGGSDLTAGLQSKVSQLSSVAQNAVQAKIQSIGSIKVSYFSG